MRRSALIVALGVTDRFGDAVGNPVPAYNPAAWWKKNTGITTTLGKVSQWTDQSGNGRHLLQAVALNQPTRAADGAVLCDGITQFMRVASFGLAQAVTLYIRGQQIAWASGKYVTDGTTLNTMIVQQTNGGASPQLRLFAGGATPSNSDLAVGVYGTIEAVFNGVSSSILINNGTPVTGNAGTASPGGITLAADGDPVPGNHCNFQYKEVIAFAGTLTAAQRSAVRAYLATV